MATPKVFVSLSGCAIDVLQYLTFECYSLKCSSSFARQRLNLTVHKQQEVGQGNLGLVIADGTNTATSTDPSVGEINVWTTPRALSINSTGGGGAHANMAPFLALNFIIKS